MEPMMRAPYAGENKPSAKLGSRFAAVAVGQARYGAQNTPLRDSVRSEITSSIAGVAQGYL